MKPSRSILDETFEYVPSVATSVTETWRRFGWRPRAEVKNDGVHYAGSTQAAVRYGADAFARWSDGER